MRALHFLRLLYDSAHAHAADSTCGARIIIFTPSREGGWAPHAHVHARTGRGSEREREGGRQKERESEVSQKRSRGCGLAHPALSLSAPVEHGDVVQVQHLRLCLPRLDQPADVAVDPGGGRVLHGGGGEGRAVPQLLRGGAQSSPLPGGNAVQNFS